MNYNILLGLTGSVGSVLHEKLKYELSRIVDKVTTVATNSAIQFIPDFNKLNYLHDSSEKQYTKGDSVLHIDLGIDNDIFVIAPASANTIPKLANGISDNLLTTTILAKPWYKPCIICPAMNTRMWENPIVQNNIKTLEKYGFIIVPPQTKLLACGEFGDGAMCEIDVLLSTIIKTVQWEFPLKFCTGIPRSKHHGDSHPGAFGSVRKHDIHTGIDLYTNEFESVYAVETGVIIKIEQFTGKNVGSPWWNDTDCILIQGTSGNVCYGEIKVQEHLKIGDRINKGDAIGMVVSVLPKSKIRQDIEGHSNSMLHLELYHRSKTTICNDIYEVGLRDPTPHLLYNNKYNYLH